MGGSGDDKRGPRVTCRGSEDVGRVHEVFGDDANGAVQLADPPAVNVVLLDPEMKT